MVPNGIHVSLVIIDGIVDLPKTRERMPNKPDSFLLNLTMLHLRTQIVDQALPSLYHRYHLCKHKFFVTLS